MSWVGSQAPYRRQRIASSPLLRLHSSSGSTSKRPQAILRESVRVPACRRAHVISVAACVDSLVEALVVARLLLLVGPGMLVLGVHVALRQRSVGVELARGHAMQRARLLLVAVGTRRPRRRLVVRGVHGVWCGED